jgi:uncharacterized membrane protein
MKATGVTEEYGLADDFRWLNISANLFKTTGSRGGIVGSVAGFWQHHPTREARGSSGSPENSDCSELRMAPFVVLVGLFLLLSVLGHFSVFGPYDWWTSLRVALAGMFLLTASAHWGRRRQDLVRMVPPALPHPELLVTVTGVLEILGAVGLMHPATAPYAALGLSVMLIAVFPANVHGAQKKLTIAGRPVLALVPRALGRISGCYGGSVPGWKALRRLLA